MAQEKPNRLREWYLAFREHAPTLRQGFGDWLEAVRAEPVLLWQTPAVRYAVYSVVVVVLALSLRWGVSAMTPPPPTGAREVATSADFHVICAHPDCGKHFVIRRAFGFNGFPVSCPHCGQSEGLRAVSCTADDCTQRWMLPEPGS